MKPTEYQGVLFFEDAPDDYISGEPISTEIGGVFRNAQLANLNDVKMQLASECKSRGFNAIIKFKYGQKSSGILASIFSRDDVKWYGTGLLARKKINS
mgnify:FL=1